MKENILEIPKYGIKVEVWLTDDGEVDGGTIKSILKRGDNSQHDAAMDGVETMILNHAVEQIDITSESYVKGLDTSVEFIKDTYRN